MENFCSIELTDNIKEYRRNYYQKNKETKYKKKCKCDVCGTEYIYTNKTHHTESNKHKNAVLKQRLEFLEEKIKQINNLATAT